MIVACLQVSLGDRRAISTAFRANSGSAMKSAKNALPVSIHCCSASIFGRSLYITYCSALYCVTQVPISRLCSGIMDKMTFAKPFGDMLKEKRKLRGLSQMGLAMKSGRSLRCIQYLEAGTQEPTLSTLYALAHALDLRVWQVFREWAHQEVCLLYDICLCMKKGPLGGLLGTACLK